MPRRALADRLLARDYARRRAIARRDPRWPGNSPRTPDDHATLTELEQELEVLSGIPPRPWLPLLRFWSSRPARRALHALRHARQRLMRGWDDTAVWSLDTHLARTLAAQLRHLADVSHGWPGPPWDTPEQWFDDLRAHAALLERYAAHHSIVNEDRFAAAFSGSSTASQRRAALDELRDEESRVIAQGQLALVWVATVLPHLWD